MTETAVFGEGGSGCHSCKFWKQRYGDIGWCDYGYPMEKRGLTKPNHICTEWEATPDPDASHEPARDRLPDPLIDDGEVVLW